MSTPEPDPVTPEPVLTVEWWKASVAGLLLAAVSILGALDVWHPTDDQVTAFTAGAAVIVPIIFTLVAYFVRKKVTPNVKVALTTADVKVLDAWASAPPNDAHTVFPSPSAVQDPGYMQTPTGPIKAV